VREDRLREARQRQSAQRRRAGELRGRVVAISLICFALLWGIVFVQMATGNDPVLSAKRAAAGTSGGHRKTAAKRAPRAEPEPAEAAEPEVKQDDEFEEAEPEFEPEPEAEFAPEEETELVEPEPEPEPLVTSQS
jgi:hypothetical protein